MPASEQTSPTCVSIKTTDPAVDGKDGWDTMCQKTPYIILKNGLVSCCMPATYWAVDLNHPAEGNCCQQGLAYSFDPLTRKGDCCMPGQIFSGTTCQSSILSANSDQPLHATDNKCPSCGNGNVCTYNGLLGIRYGHCYTMKDTSNREFMRDDTLFYKGADTTVEGHLGLPFRICLTTTNCTQNLNQYVPEGGSWYQRDEMGANTYTGPSFVSTSGNSLIIGNPAVPTLYPPANLTGKGTCIFGECAICVQFGDGQISGYHGMARTAGYLITAVPNPSTCMQYHYEETACSPAVNGAP